MIKNEIHHVWFGGAPFSLLNHLAIKSARLVNEPARQVLHLDAEPAGEWWERSKEFVELDPMEAPTQVAGRPLRHVAHQADVARLSILRESGGIYLDTDVVCVRSFEPLLGHELVLGIEEEDAAGCTGLCNAVILAVSESPFLARWQAGFDPETSDWHGFRSRGRDKYWAEMSVRYPAHLAKKHPSEVTVLPQDRFFSPMCYEHELEEFFLGGFSVAPDAYCHHLWQSSSWVRDNLGQVTSEEIRCVDSTFNRIARHILDA